MRIDHIIFIKVCEISLLTSTLRRSAKETRIFNIHRDKATGVGCPMTIDVTIFLFAK